MRKRKRGYGTYLDEETGETTTVETTKQAKRNHQKNGKWYKEPTEAEIRAWERDEKKQAAAERAVQREENKKANAGKRAEQQAKEREVKRRMFEAGKITFTQTLAKKDEDQLNLHSWFGGKPKGVKGNIEGGGVEECGVVDGQDKDNGGEGGNKEADNANVNTSTSFDAGAGSNVSARRRAVCDSSHLKLVRQLSHGSIHEGDNLEEIDASFADHTTKSSENPKPETMTDQNPQVDTMDHLQDLDLDLFGSSQDFDILEDSDAETETHEPELEAAEQDSYQSAFKVPALPDSGRLPLSPMSQSDMNVRATEALQVSSFKDRLAKADVTHSSITSGTQAVRDLLSGISTQDLALDLENDDAEDLNDKENDEPEAEDCSEKVASPSKTPHKSSPLKQVTTANIDLLNQSFTSLNESFDYDNIFAELDAGDVNCEEAPFTAPPADNFDEYGLDDAIFLSLPATQLALASSARLTVPTTTTPFCLPSMKQTSFSAPAKPTNKLPSTHQPFAKTDSFAIEGLDDDDLLQGLQEYERSQQRMTSSLSVRKRRLLPWEKRGWSALVRDGDGEVEGNGEM